jgi:biotin-[acetyl-CoA-carboxylase] ligase BirA-like protein
MRRLPPSPTPGNTHACHHCRDRRPPRAEARRFDIDVLDSCDSTNAVLLARAEAGAPSGTVVIANEQTAGRGRRGRSWFASRGDSLTFSLLWRFAPGTAPAGLSLAVGLAVAQALEKVGAGGTALKWPNDILKDGRKLGGILVELLPGAPHAAVIGIGINLHPRRKCPMNCVPPRPRSTCRRRPTNALYAALLAELLASAGKVRRRRLRPAARRVARAPRLSGCRCRAQRPILARRAAASAAVSTRRRAAVRKRRPRRARALRRSFAAPGHRDAALPRCRQHPPQVRAVRRRPTGCCRMRSITRPSMGCPRLPAKPTRIVACNVAGAAVRQRIEALAGTLGLPLAWLSSSAAACGVSNAYDTPQQLGADRWAALIGARALHGGPAWW